MECTKYGLEKAMLRSILVVIQEGLEHLNKDDSTDRNLLSPEIQEYITENHQRLIQIISDNTPICPHENDGKILLGEEYKNANVEQIFRIGRIIKQERTHVLLTKEGRKFVQEFMMHILTVIKSEDSPTALALFRRKHPLRLIRLITDIVTTGGIELNNSCTKEGCIFLVEMIGDLFKHLHDYNAIMINYMRTNKKLWGDRNTYKIHK